MDWNTNEITINEREVETALGNDAVEALSKRGISVTAFKTESGGNWLEYAKDGIKYCAPAPQGSLNAAVPSNPSAKCCEYVCEYACSFESVAENGTNTHDYWANKRTPEIDELRETLCSFWCDWEDKLRVDAGKDHLQAMGCHLPALIEKGLVCKYFVDETSDYTGEYFLLGKDRQVKITGMDKEQIAEVVSNWDNAGIAMDHKQTLEDLEQELVRKIEDEYADYVETISKLPVERIINGKSLETARKQEIMDRLCGGGVSDWGLDENQIERLLARDNLLNDLYFAYDPSQETYDLEADDFQSCINYVARDTTIRKRDIERD